MMIRMLGRIAAGLLVGLVLLSGWAIAAPPVVQIDAHHGKSWRGMCDGLPVLMLRGTHRERGEAHGRLAGKEIVKSCDQLATFLKNKLPGGWNTAIVVCKQFQVPKRFREELEGMLAGIEQVTTPEERKLQAAGRAINVDDLVLLNTADVFELFRCSQFSAWGPAAGDEKLIVGRNFDYPPLLPRENFCVLAVEPDEEGLHATMDALFFGFIGCGISAIRDDGMYVAPNSGGPSPREILPKEAVPTAFIFRTWLETAQPGSAVDELDTQMKTHSPLPLLLHVVPAKSELGKQTPVILEFTPSRTEPTSVVRKPEEGVPALFVANHHVKNAADLAKGRSGILKTECEKCLAGGAAIDFDAARNILHAARQDTTYVSAVSRPYAGRMKVAVAEPGKVATESRFYTVDWQAIREAK
jgi:hypothetical protein